MSTTFLFRLGMGALRHRASYIPWIKGQAKYSDKISLMCYNNLKNDERQLGTDVYKSMAYYIDLFSPETYFAYSDSDRSISGFRERQKGIASLIKAGDKLICYMTKLSRWVGILEVTSSFFVDDSPIFIRPIDPFIIRFKVIPHVWLLPEQAVPINQDICWKYLSFTKVQFTRDYTG